MHNAVNEWQEQYPFEEVGDIQSTLTILGATAQDEDSVNAIIATKRVIYTIPNGTPAVEIRFRSVGTTDDTAVLEVYAKPKTPGSAEKLEHYVNIGRLTLDEGTQDSNDEHFVDVVSAASVVWTAGLTVETTTHKIGRARLNTNGYEKILFIATALAQSKLYIDVKRHDREF